MNIIDKIDSLLINEGSSVDVENFIRKSMNVAKSQDAMWKLVKAKFKGDIDDGEFDEMWESFLEDGFLVKAGGDKYKWSN